MLQRSAEAVVRHLDAAFARIWTIDEQQNVLELQASAGLYTRLDGEHARVPVGKLKIGLIAQQRKPHLTNDILNDEHISNPGWAKQQRMVSFAAPPNEGRLWVLAMFARKFLGQDTIEALEVVADTVAQGIERKQPRRNSPAEPDADCQRVQPCPCPGDGGVRPVAASLPDPRGGRRPSNGMGRLP
jgi:GAF domain-containing protein